MSWSKVGDFLTEHGSKLLKLAGAVATGGSTAGIAAVASMVMEATGEKVPEKALNKLQADPATLIRLEELAMANEADIRANHRALVEARLRDDQSAHTEQQNTIRQGDQSSDEYVRRTRPKMARESWLSTAAYCLGSGVAKAFDLDIFVVEIAMILISPAAAYLGFRSADKIWGKK